MQITDSFKHKGMRRQMVDTLRVEGIKDEKVLAAMLKIPRHIFLDTAFEEYAYQNRAFPIAKSQTISSPYTVAFQSSLLELIPGETVLEIGTGSGYQASVLAEMGVKLYTIERHAALSQKAKKILNALGYNRVRCIYGDGFEGLPAFAPFDKILITAAAPQIPENLLTQLKVGGYMIVPLGEGDTQEMLRITRITEGEYDREVFGKFVFVPMLKGTED